MIIFQVVLFAITVTLLFLLLKDIHFTFAFLLITIASILLFLFIIDQLRQVISVILFISDQTSISHQHIQILLKVVGITYITEIGANLSKDAGLQSIASKVELIGKLLIIILALPIIYSIIELVMSIVPTYIHFPKE